MTKTNGANVPIARHTKEHKRTINLKSRSKNIHRSIAHTKAQYYVNAAPNPVAQKSKQYSILSMMTKHVILATQRLTKMTQTHLNAASVMLRTTATKKTDVNNHCVSKKSVSAQTKNGYAHNVNFR